MGGAAVQYQGSPQAMARSKSRRNNSRGSVSKREVGYLVAQIHGGKGEQGPAALRRESERARAERRHAYARACIHR